MQHDSNEFNDRRTPPRPRSFWISGSGYYMLIVAISAGCFFLFWGVLSDGGVEAPWITAGIAASIVLAGGVVLREVFIRRSRRQNYSRGRRFDIDTTVSPRSRNKLTVEQNAKILASIKEKSNAAKILNTVSAGHREVFEMCGEYLQLIDRELKTVNAGSPRLAALLKGRAKAAAYHRFHTLRWAEIEATDLTMKARLIDNPDQRFEAAEQALAVVERAMTSYPAERPLRESHEVLTELVVSIKVTAYIEEAEAAVQRGDDKSALGFYREALFYLGRDNVHTPGREAAAERVRSAIERLQPIDKDEI